MVFKIALLIIFVAATIYIGYYSRKKATSVDGFVLGGRKIGPWMSAFAYGTSYFSAVVFIGYAGGFCTRMRLPCRWRIALPRTASCSSYWILTERA